LRSRRAPAPPAGGGGEEEGDVADGGLTRQEREALQQQAVAISDPVMTTVALQEWVDPTFASPGGGSEWVRLQGAGMVMLLPRTWTLAVGEGSMLGMATTVYESSCPLKRLATVARPGAEQRRGDQLAFVPPFGLTVTVYHDAVTAAAIRAFRPGRSYDDFSSAASVAPSHDFDAAAAAQFLSQLYMVRWGPGGVTPDDDGEHPPPDNPPPPSGRGDSVEASSDSAHAGDKPEVLRSWARTLTRSEAGLSGDGVISLHGLEYVLTGNMQPAGVNADGVAPVDQDDSSPAIRLRHFLTYVADPTNGSIREIAFTCPDAWWDDLWSCREGSDAGRLDAETAAALRQLTSLVPPMSIEAIVDGMVIDGDTRRGEGLAGGGAQHGLWSRDGSSSEGRRSARRRQGVKR